MFNNNNNNYSNKIQTKLLSLIINKLIIQVNFNSKMKLIV